MELVRPYPLLLIILTIGLTLAIRRQSGRSVWLKLCIAAVGLLWLASSPIVSYGLLALLEHPFAPLRVWPDECRTIVVLAGSMNQNEEEDLAARLGETSLRRCMEAARLYHKYGHPQVIVSGGPLRSEPEGPTVAKAMEDFLIRLGVSGGDVLLEEKSRTTFENGIKTAQLMDATEASIVLVTDAAHMPRASKSFRSRNFNVTPASCHFQSPYCFAPVWEWLIPSTSALEKTHYAIHEYLGGIWYRLRESVTPNFLDADAHQYVTRDYEPPLR
jgi:uncharacterized SAM-binding protein YcdF (DUF218 family)